MNIYDYTDNKQIVKINDIGCHNGSLFLKMMNRLGSDLRNKIIELDAIDPSKPAINEFREKDNGEYNITYFNMAYENFEPILCYDLTIASHCLYWSPSLECLVKKMIDNSKITYITLRGKRGIFEIQSQFKHCVGNKLEQFYNADDISLVLDNMNNDKLHVSKHLFTSDLRISSCKLSGDVEGEKLISFFLQTQYSVLSNKDKNNVLEWFRVKPDTIPHDIAIFIIVNNEVDNG